MPPGHNGPYNDQETPVRNTSHWAITFARAYEITGNNVFKKSVEDATAYLLQDKCRPSGKTFYHRISSGKDSCNGLIGQAWSIEALCRSHNVLKDKELLEVAENVFTSHPFNHNFGLWGRTEINGENLGLDMTFNHQLWFAMAGSLLEKKTDSCEVSRQISIFLKKINENLRIFESGLIQHHIHTPLKNISYGMIKGDVRAIKSFLRTYIGRSQLYQLTFGDISKSDLIYKSIGYHSFNLLALAILKNNRPNNPFWECSTFESIFEFSKSNDYIESIDSNKYGYPYNPSGFEIAYFWHICGNEPDTLKSNLIEKQLSDHYDQNTMLMEKNTCDPRTLAARMYELTWSPNLTIKLDGME